MNKEKRGGAMKKIIFIFIFLMLLFPFGVRADFRVSQNGSFVEKNYLAGDEIAGQVNISFSNQKNEKFVSNFPGGISLIDLLRNMSYTQGVEYSCSQANCETGYGDGGFIGNRAFTTNLPTGKRAYGFKIVGENISQITSLKFNVTSDAPESCQIQITFDLFSDEKTDFFNNKSSSQPCSSYSPNYGCFNSGNTQGNVIIGTDLYCERVSNISSAPAYKIGAKLAGNSERGGNLELYLFDEDGNRLRGWMMVNTNT